MAYVKDALGSTASTVNSVADYVNKAIPALDSVKVILDDPYLPEVAGLVLKLNTIERRSGGSSTKGIGLKRVVTPLKIYVQAREKPLLGYALLAAAVALPIAIGYSLGKK